MVAVLAAASTGAATGSTTDTPTLTSPAEGSTTTSPVTVTYTLPEAAKAGATVAFTSSSGTWTLTLGSGGRTAGTHSFTLNPANPNSPNTKVSGSVPTTAMPDGAYTVTLTYQDTLSNPAASATANFTLDTTTQAPTITSTAGTRVRTSFPVSYSLPEGASSGSIILTTSGVTWTLTLTAAARTAGAHSFTIDVANPGADTANISSASPAGGLADGTYSVTVSYRDSLANPAATASTSVIVDTVTLTPTLTTPASSGTYGTSVTLGYLLPEAAFSGSITLTSAGGTWTLVLAASALTAGNHSHVVNMANPTASPYVSSSSPSGAIPAGTYSVQLSYQDVLANPSATSSTATNVTFDQTTLAPTISAPIGGSAHRSAITTTYTLPEAGAAASITFAGAAGTWTMTLDAAARAAGSRSVTVNPQDPVGGSAGRISSVSPAGPIPDGAYTVSVSYGDLFGNAAASASTTGVVIDTATLPPTIATPTAGQYAGLINLDYTLPEVPMAGTVTLTLRSACCQWTLTMASPAAGRSQWALDPSVPGASPQVASISAPGPIVPGTYALELSYRDALGNAIATTRVEGVRIGPAGTPVAPDSSAPAGATPAPAPAPPVASTGSATTTCRGTRRQVATCTAKKRLASSLARCTAGPASRRKACSATARSRYARDIAAAGRLK